MTSTRYVALAAASGLYCVLAWFPMPSHADSMDFTVDSSQSYITLNIPNFSWSGNNINVTAMNRTNGVPISTAWSASTSTGNTAFMSGTLSTTIGGSFAGQTLTSIQFISGANSLYAINSGNYRPNPAAYNFVTSIYNNNGPAGAVTGLTLHTLLGNSVLVSFDNVRYDLGSNELPASGTFRSGTLSTNTPANPLNFGILDSLLSVQGLSEFIVGQLIPNDSSNLGIPLTGNLSSTLGSYQFTSPYSLQIRLPVLIPFSIDAGNGLFLNGTATGRIVANSPAPEPSTMMLVLSACACSAAIARRRLRKSAPA